MRRPPPRRTPVSSSAASCPSRPDGVLTQTRASAAAAPSRRWPGSRPRSRRTASSTRAMPADLRRCPAVLVMSEEAVAKYGHAHRPGAHRDAAGDDPVIRSLPRSRPPPWLSACRSTHRGVRGQRGVRRFPWRGWPIPGPTRQAQPERRRDRTGHLLGGSGGRLMADMIAHMRGNDIAHGPQTMCEGGGQPTPPSSNCLILPGGR